MSAFNPDLITNPRLKLSEAQKKAVPQVDQMPEVQPEIAPAAPIPAAPSVPPVMPKPIILPVPAPRKQEKPKTLQISADVARKAQGIYPAEQQAKQNMIENAKAPPAPLGAWGKPS